MKLSQAAQASRSATASSRSFNLILLVLGLLLLILAVCLTVSLSPRLIPLCGLSLRRRLETYQQANGRVTRPGQTKKTLVVHLCGSAVERKLYRNLQDKAKTQGTLLEMFEGKQVSIRIL